VKFNLKQLEAFVWVADMGSFRKAAARLNTTQPNISARISALESALDVVLMERDAGSVRLTSRGQILLEHARTVLNASESLLDAANREALVDGVLRLGVTEMVVHTWLRDFLRVFKHRYPNITVELTVDLSVNLEKELFERSIDLALQSGPFNRQTTGTKDLGVYPLIWIASPETGLHVADEVSMEDLAKLPILTHARGTQPHNEVAAHFASRRDLSARLAPSSNLAACIHMTIDGFGAATVPASMVVDELKSGELCRINYEWVPKSLSFFARYDADKSPRFVARAAEIASEVSLGFVLEFASRP
jgi:DNA-binding transcriptional LysR family regulator